jgi:glycosyltransferase involved in cell wall biosynthesis
MRRFRSQLPASSRRLIMLKGRQDDLGGRALFALQALHLCAEYLSDYEIAIYMPSDIVACAARYVTQMTGLRFRTIPHRTPHDEIVRLMGNSRIGIGVGVTDGTPNAMLEAMVMGAFPIQSNTADTRGWIEDGKNGLLVPPQDSAAIAAAIRKAVVDDRMVDEASEINARITKERIDISIVKPQAVRIYEKIAHRGR